MQLRTNKTGSFGREGDTVAGGIARICTALDSISRRIGPQSETYKRAKEQTVTPERFCANKGGVRRKVDTLTRRKRPTWAPAEGQSLSLRAVQHLHLLEQSLALADLAYQSGSLEEARARAKEVLGHAFMAVAPALDPGSDGRDRLKAIVSLLVEAAVFRGDMEQLAVALEALDRGEAIPPLCPRSGGRRGGARPTEDWHAMRCAVEAARVLKALSGKSEAYREELNKCGTAPRTIEGYEKKLAGSRFEPRQSYVLAHGFDDPRDVLRYSIELLAAT